MLHTLLESRPAQNMVLGPVPRAPLSVGSRHAGFQVYRPLEAPRSDAHGCPVHTVVDGGYTQMVEWLNVCWLDHFGLVNCIPL